MINNCFLRKWKHLKRENIFEAPPWIKIYKDKIKLPNGRILEDYYIIDTPSYVVIYATNSKGEILFENQYRHSLGEIDLALPTGCIDDDEEPLDSAKRELLEETGYQAENWKEIGTFTTGAGFGCGKAYFFVANNLKKIAEPKVDDTEEIEIKFLSREQAYNSAKNGEIKTLAPVALLFMAGEITK